MVSGIFTTRGMPGMAQGSSPRKERDDEERVVELRPAQTAGAVAALEAGRDALSRGAWEEARSALEEALREGDSPEALYGLGDALWWLGDIRESARCLERAYAAFRRRPDPVQAFLSAVQLALLYQANLGNYAAAGGWAARVERLVDEFDLEPLRGWALLVKACGGAGPDRIEAWTRQALRIAAETGDRDLELCALSQTGMALVEQGKIGEGVPLMDEAMAGALAGEGEMLDTVVFTSCLMFRSCDRCADFQRLVQWVRATDRFVERYGCPYLNATCRAHYGSVLFASGDWIKAEKELRKALDLADDAQPAVRGEALARLAELRFFQGHIEEAEELLTGFEEHEAAVAVRARIQLSRGKFSLAGATLRRRLDVIVEKSLESSLLLELLGESEVGQGRAEAAAERGRKLSALGEDLGCRLMFARGERLRGHALAARGDGAARRNLDAALREFARLEMPFEAARARLMLARSLREPEVAGAEARTALAVFEDLGASGNADAAITLLREMEEAPETSSTGLSKRETEVLCLVAQGLSDKEIAARLVLSRHTVHRHVSSILAKLGLPSRTAAATYAARHGLLP